MSPLLLGHLANFAFAAAYLVRDARMLRALSIVGCSLCAVFNYAAPATPLWTAIGWNVFFAVVNLGAIACPKRKVKPVWRAPQNHVRRGW